MGSGRGWRLLDETALSVLHRREQEEERLLGRLLLLPRRPRHEGALPLLRSALPRRRVRAGLRRRGARVRGEETTTAIAAAHRLASSWKIGKLFVGHFRFGTSWIMFNLQTNTRDSSSDD